jgi:hypothetical protein
MNSIYSIMMLALMAFVTTGQTAHAVGGSGTSSCILNKSNMLAKFHTKATHGSMQRSRLRRVINKMVATMENIRDVFIKHKCYSEVICQQQKQESYENRVCGV